MAKKKISNELLEWLEQNPELANRLDKMREISQQDGDETLTQVELGLIEQMRLMAREGLQGWAQGKEAGAYEQAKERGKGRKSSKKN